MIAKFFRTRARTRGAAAAIPDGQRVYAVGDIHGCIDLLDALLAKVDADDVSRGPAQTTLIFLGDIVDRGPASAAVVDRLIGLAETRADVRFLLGNHEEIFLDALDGDAKALRLFCRIGGRETVMSYGIDAAEYERLDYAELAARLEAMVPAHHRVFLQGFGDLVTIGDYAFVHAGVRPGRAFDEQRTADLRWIRDPFLDHSSRLEKIVVHGHTVTDMVERRIHRIGIDTGAYASGRLTALGLEGDRSWHLDTADVAATTKSMAG